jgi:uncharacterized protein YciI
MEYFVVINGQGPRWVDSRTMREQEQWSEHAEFINALVREGFLVLAGPLGEGSPHRAMQIFHAPSAAAVRSRLETDPWIRSGILRTVSLDAWKVLASDDRLDRVLAEITRPRGPS